MPVKSFGKLNARACSFPERQDRPDSFEKAALQFGLFWYSGGVLPTLLSVQTKWLIYYAGP
jgi:hypothetical protein